MKINNDGFEIGPSLQNCSSRQKISAIPTNTNNSSRKKLFLKFSVYLRTLEMTFTLVFRLLEETRALYSNQSREIVFSANRMQDHTDPDFAHVTFPALDAGHKFWSPSLIGSLFVVIVVIGTEY